MAVVLTLGFLCISATDMPLCSFHSAMFLPNILGSRVKSFFEYTALACAPSLNLVSSVSNLRAGEMTFSLFDAAEVLRTRRRATDGWSIVLARVVPYVVRSA